MGFHVSVRPLGVEFDCAPGGTLLDALRDAGIGMESACGGLGTCGRCRVRVLAGEVSGPTPDELEHLTSDMIGEGTRLACQASPESDLTLYLPASSLTTRQRLQTGSSLPVGPPDPVARDGGPPGVDMQGRSPLGLAVDLGSTKIACFLFDLAGGELLARRGLLNPQIPYGGDIVTRIQQAGAGHARRLGRLVVDGLNEAAAGMAAEAGREAGDIVEMALVGNTVMHHLFLSLPVEQLGRSPFLPAALLPIERKARDLGLEFNSAAVAYFPPPIAGFVGSDHLAAVAAARLWERPGPCLLLDIGTNTEVALLANGIIRCCSCASGPAFEGGSLSQGMRAGDGAIEEVVLDPVTGEIMLSVVGDAPPAGICGSGILSALAALTTAGIVDVGGRLWDDRPGVTVRDGETVFYLSGPEEGGGGGVAVTQTDIREIQKAKGAIRAGVDALLLEAGVAYGDLKEIVLAGAFGTYIDPADALAVALLPPVPIDLIDQVGNAAGAGVSAMLLSARLRAEAEETARRIEHLELSAYPRLSHLFAAGMYLSEEAVGDAKRRFRL